VAAAHLAQQPDDKGKSCTNNKRISRHKDAQGEKEGSKELGQKSEVVEHFYYLLWN